MSNVTSKSRQVAVGPVAHQLYKRRPPRRSWLPKLALAICTLACGFVVHAALKNREIWLDQNLLIASLQYPAATPKARSTKRDSKSDSQVLSVIELVGAFEHLANEDAEQRNPLALPEDSPTAPVAFYAPPPTASANNTAEFLEQINIQPVKQTSTNEVAPELASQQERAPEELQEIAPAEVASLRMHGDDGVAVAEPLERVDTPSVVLPDAAMLATNDNTEHDQVLHDETAEDDVDLDGDLASESDELPEEVVAAMTAFDQALAMLKDDPANRKLSRQFYAALASLGAITWSDENEPGKDRLRQFCGDPQLVELAASAASSWLGWSQRQTPGIVVAGTIQSVKAHESGFLVAVKTRGRKSEVLTLLVQDELDSYTMSAKTAVFYGVIVEPTEATAPLIQAKLCPRID